MYISLTNCLIESVSEVNKICRSSEQVHSFETQEQMVSEVKRFLQDSILISMRGDKRSSVLYRICARLTILLKHQIFLEITT